MTLGLAFRTDFLRNGMRTVGRNMSLLKTFATHDVPASVSSVTLLTTHIAGEGRSWLWTATDDVVGVLLAVDAYHLLAAVVVALPSPRQRVRRVNLPHLRIFPRIESDLLEPVVTAWQCIQKFDGDPLLRCRQIFRSALV